MLITLSADEHIVHIGSFLFVGGDGDGRGDGWLCDLLNLNTPFVFWPFEIGESELRLAVRDNDIYSILPKYPMYLRNGLIRIGS